MAQNKPSPEPDELVSKVSPGTITGWEALFIWQK